MKKFQFTLDKLCRYKNQILDTQKNHLCQLRQAQRELESRMERLTAGMEEADDRLKEEQRVGTTIGKIRIYEYRIQNIRSQAAQLRLEIKRAEIEVEKQLQAVLAATQEVAGLDKLREQQLEEYRKEQLRAEETAVEEFISAKLAG